MYQYKTEESANGSLFYFKSNNEDEFSLEIIHSQLSISTEIPILEISIDCMNQPNPKQDNEVGETVCYIINQHLINQPQHVLIYICDSVDYRAHLRDKKFTNWYASYNGHEQHRLLKFKYDIDMGDMTLEHFTSAAFDNTVYSNGQIETVFSNYTDELTNLKNAQKIVSS